MTPAASTSRVLTLVFTDLADSTALKTQRGDVVVGELIARHRAHVTRLAEECAGRVIDWAGDGCFLTFDTSSAGVLFALRLQQVHADDPDLPRVRIGIHMGEVTEKPNPEGDEKHPRIEGLAVDIAARISGLARPGQVLMSSAVYASARQRLGVEAFGKPVLWQTHGTYELKGFDEPLDIGEATLEGFATFEAPKSAEKARLIKKARKRPGAPRVPSKTRRSLVPIVVVGLVSALVAGVLYAVLSRPVNERTAESPPATVDSPTTKPAQLPSNEETEAARTSIEKLAVLPFDNMSSDPEQDFFVDGMTEALIAELAKVKSIKVISRTSVMQYKGSDRPSLPEIAQALGVDALIEGSVMKAGNEVRITAQLVHGRTDEHLWAESYTNTLENVFKLQAEVALEITKEINATVTADEHARISSAKTVDPRAFELYVQARHFWSQRLPDDLRTARRLFEQALEIDPDFALGHVGLADTYFIMNTRGIIPYSEGITQSRAHVDKALELDPNLGEAYVTLGMLRLIYEWDWEGAEQGLRRGIELNPNHASAWQWLGTLMHCWGRDEESFDAYETAYEVDPASQVISNNLARQYAYAGRIDDAVAQIDKALERFPDNPEVLDAAGKIYEQAGRASEAQTFYERRLSIDSNRIEAVLGLAIFHAREGNVAEARALLESVLSTTDTTEPLNFAKTYAAMGDADEAIRYLEAAVEVHEGNVPLIGTLPDFEPIRDDPRFQAILRRTNNPLAKSAEK